MEEIMKEKELAAEKFTIQRFLATVFADEISQELYNAMKADAFLIALKKASESFYSKEMGKGAKALFEFMNSSGVDTYKALKFEYADLFLNAGDNPVFPYESFYADREPTLYGEPLFLMREILKKNGLHKDPEYPEPEDHVSIQFDFLAELNRREAAGDKKAAETRRDFGRRHIAWRTEFCAVLHSADKSGFYKALSEFTLSYLFVAHLASVPPESSPILDPEADLRLLGKVLEKLPLAKESFLLKPGAIDPLPAKTIPTHCYACGSLCGMAAKVKDGVLMSTGGLRGDIKGGGRLCPKGGPPGITSIQHIGSSRHSSRRKADFVKPHGMRLWIKLSKYSRPWIPSGSGTCAAMISQTGFMKLFSIIWDAPKPLTGPCAIMPTECQMSTT